MRSCRLILNICLALVALASPAKAREFIAGPIEAEVIAVQDGDTLLVRAHVWPGHAVTVAVRLRGIDAPELKGRCAFEIMAARAARERLARLAGKGRVTLSNISGGKYFGRVLAEAGLPGGAGFAAQLLREGYVRPYSGRKRQPWCR